MEKSYSVEATAKAKKLFADNGVGWDVTEGSEVGSRVGSDNGSAVGSEVGTCDGDKDDGVAEGRKVTVLDGITVGPERGRAVGDAVSLGV